MVSGFCQTVSSFLIPKDLPGFEKRMCTALGAASLYLAGPVATLINAGLYYFGRGYVLSKETIPAEKLEIGMPAYDDYKDDHKHAPQIQFAPDVRIQVQNGAPNGSSWGLNSCFCASLMYSVLSNEPAILAEIPRAIGRKLSQLPRNLESPIHLEDLNQLTIELQSKEALTEAEKPLLSLLELYALIREFQIKPIQGETVNRLRIIADRVSFFEAVGNDRQRPMGDAQELWQILMQLIFEGSYHEQDLLKSHGQRKFPSEPNYGNFVLPLGEGSIEDHFNRSMNCNQVLRIGAEDVFGITQHQLQRPPELLTLSLQRKGVDGEAMLEPTTLEEVLAWRAPEPVMHMNPVNVSARFTLDPLFFVNREKPTYELVGVSRHLGPNHPHYDAFTKRGGQWYHCDDQRKFYCFGLFGGPVIKVAESTVLEQAKTGYVFFYRKCQ